jgi:hypothetical protein
MGGLFGGGFVWEREGERMYGGGGQYPFYCGRVIVCVRRGRLTDWGGGGREGARGGERDWAGPAWVCRVRVPGKRGVRQPLV